MLHRCFLRQLGCSGSASQTVLKVTQMVREDAGDVNSFIVTTTLLSRESNRGGEKMGKRKKNLRTQLNWAINKNFNEGIDKHAYKASLEGKHKNEATDKVFSYSSKYNLKDFSVNFSNFIKENYPNVKNVNDITTECVQGFLNEKANTCTQNTINNYMTNFRKFEKLINKTYEGAHLNYSSEIFPPCTKATKSAQRGVQAQMPRKNINMVIEHAKASECQSAYAVRLQEKLCVRVNEIVNIKNCDITDNTVTLNCKGGRELERVIDEETKELIKEIQEHNFSVEKLFSIQNDSVNKYLRETEDKLGIERNSTHDFRRTLAQEFYDNCRERGLSIADAADQTSMYLNHNKNRTEMLKECYINLI